MHIHAHTNIVKNNNGHKLCAGSIFFPQENANVSTSAHITDFWVNVEQCLKKAEQAKTEKEVWVYCASVSLFKTHVGLVRWWADVKCIPPLSKTTFSPHKLSLPQFWPLRNSFINHFCGHLSFCSIFHSPWQDWPLFPYWIFPSQKGPVGQKWGIGQALNSQSGG